MTVSAEIWQANSRRHCAREPTPKPGLVSLLYSAAGAVLDGAHSSLVAATAQRARKRAHEFRFESRVQTGTRAAVLFLSLAAATGAVAQEPNQSRETPDSASADLGSGEGSERTELNLLGAVASEEGEGRRNENVRISLIDNNVLRELTARMGTTATVPVDLAIEHRYFGGEFGQPAKRALEATAIPVPQVHSELRWTHQTSVTSARSFFQVGGVRPAHDNSYGFTLGMPLGNGTSGTFRGGQTRSRGNVNGNVLVPTPEERTPLSTDPATRAFVQRLFDAYPPDLPNRTDISPRALNTNGLQSIDNDQGSILIDRPVGRKSRLALQYSFTAQDVDAFQLVGGQNPDTSTKNHEARIGWSRNWSPRTTSNFVLGFDRVGSLLVSEETAVGPLVLMGFVIEFLGPDSNIPIDRALNRTRVAVRTTHTRGNHNLAAGAEILRRQVNGYEAESHRGLFLFGSDFGRNAITNIRLGTPSLYQIAIGNMHRGFRNWDMQYYLGDRWKASNSLTLDLGLRFEPVTAPREVHNLTTIPYDCDCNNLAPRFGFAYHLGKGLGVWRGSYAVHYGQIFNVSYGQARFSPPANIDIAVQAPDLVNPLAGFGPEDFDPSARSTVFELDPELAVPYSHQYGLEWQFRLAADWALSFGYVGSRSHKLLTLWYTNRARPVPGIPQTTETVNQRRPDPRFFEKRVVLNGSRAYFDGAKAVLSVPGWKGLDLEASYWWSKAIDLGSDFSNTASGRDARLGRSQSEFNTHGELRAVSLFDQPHALLIKANWRTPTVRGVGARLFNSWQISTVVLAKAGTPFNVVSGSDGEGFGNVDGTYEDRPNVLEPSVLGRSVDHPDKSTKQLPADAFAFISPGETAGNLGRNAFRKDGVFNINAAMTREWALRGNTALLFRAESLNLFNHPQFASPRIDLTSPNFGQITNTLNDGRAFRFTLELKF